MVGRSDRAKGRALCARAARLLDVDRGKAEELYRESLRLDPELKEAWFDLGLIAKWEGRWEMALECNLRAAELEGPRSGEPAWWNLGIAATALRDWDVARRAWATYGVALPPGDGPIEADLGLCPVRLDAGGSGEVVWGTRIDPARIRISNIPFPRSEHRWADVVLHDGAPNGSREINGRTVPVFDELALWESSGVPTLEVTVRGDAPSVERLVASVDDRGHAIEDWTRNVRMICSRCSEGALHAEHPQHELAAGTTHFLGIAAAMSDVESLLHEWAMDDGCEVLAVEVGL